MKLKKMNGNLRILGYHISKIIIIKIKIQKNMIVNYFLNNI